MLGSKNSSILISNWTRHVSQCLKQVRAGKNQKIKFVTSSESVHANASSSSSSPQSPSVLSESSPLNQSILSSHLPRHSSTPLSSPQPLQVTPPSQLESPEGEKQLPMNMSANPCMFRSQRSQLYPFAGCDQSGFTQPAIHMPTSNPVASSVCVPENSQLFHTCMSSAPLPTTSSSPHQCLRSPQAPPVSLFGNCFCPSLHFCF